MNTFCVGAARVDMPGHYQVDSKTDTRNVVGSTGFRNSVMTIHNLGNGEKVKITIEITK